MVDCGKWTTKANHHRDHGTLPRVRASLDDFCAHQLELSEQTISECYNWKGSIGNQHREGCATERETGEHHTWPFSWALHSRCLSQQELEKFPIFQKFTLNSHFKLFWNANIKDKIMWNWFAKTEMCHSRTHLSILSELKTVI